MHVIFVATDVFGQKLNFELEFMQQPTVPDLTRHIEAVFSAEQQARRPGHPHPYKVAKLNVVDEATEDWVEVVSQGQLRNYCQVYAFQPHSTQLTESQGHIPPATKPRHLPVAAPATAAPVAPVQTQVPTPAPVPAAPVPAPTPAPAPVSVPIPTHPPAGAAGGYATGAAQVRLLPQDAGHDEKVRACFEGLDANANRVLELDEMKRGFQMFGMDFTTATVDDLFKKADADRDGVINFPEWQRFAELYPTMLDSLYYRLKSHWEIVAGKNELDQLAALGPKYQEQERLAKAAFDQTQSDIDEADRRAAEVEQAAVDVANRQRASEEAAKEAGREVDTCAQLKSDRERALAGERERERQASIASQHSARELDAAQHRLAQVQGAVVEAEAAERRAAQVLAEAQREFSRLRAASEQANAEVAVAADRHNKILAEYPHRSVEEAVQALARADQDLVTADQKQRELTSISAQCVAQLADFQRQKEEAVRATSLARERREPMRACWLEARQAIEDHSRQLSEKESQLAAEISQKRLLHSQEKALVEEEVRLREQRESLEVKEGALRNAHTSFFKPRTPVAGAGGTVHYPGNY